MEATQDLPSYMFLDISLETNNLIRSDQINIACCVLRVAREPLVERAYCPHFVLDTSYQVSTVLWP
jgi:hypothetical protein